MRLTALDAFRGGVESLLPSDPTRAIAAAEWEYRSSGAGPVPREEADIFQRRLDAAVRAARGAGVAFTLRACSGSCPALYLRTETAEARRWATRSLLPVYPRHAWAPSLALKEGLEFPLLWGQRRLQWPERLHGTNPAPPILDVWMTALAAQSKGLVIEARFVPLSTSRLPTWELRLPRSSVRVLPSARSERTGIGLASPGLTDREVPIEHPAGWRATIRIGPLYPGTPTRQVQALALVLDRSSRSDLGNGIIFHGRSWGRIRGARGFLIAESELTQFLPTLGLSIPLAAPPVAAHQARLPLGRTDGGWVVGPSLDPSQGRHLAILGETGMGKSSLLVAIARRVSREHGLILLDPLGPTASSVERVLSLDDGRRLLRIAPIKSPLRINALEGAAASGPEEAVKAERRLNDLVHSLRRVREGRYVDSAYWGPRLEEMLTRALEAAAAWPEGTLADAHTMLATGGRLHREIPPAALGPARELSRRIRERPEDAEGARRLLHEIVRSQVLRSMLCAERPDRSISEFARPGQIVIVSGDAGTVGESTARYLLSVYLALAWSAILSRPTAAKTFILLDEAQWFAHEGLAEMLRLGRFVNLHVVLATQSIAALPPTVAEAVWTNVADFVAFRGSPEVARELARMSREVSVERLLSLPRGEAAVLLGKGHSVYWLRTLRLPSTVERGPEPPGGLDGSRGSPVGPSPEGATAGPSPRFDDEPRGSPGPVSISKTDCDEEAWSTSVPEPSVDDVLLLLRNCAATLEPGTYLSVRLEELRRRVDPRGTAVRRAGGILAKAGALIAIDRTEGGTVWKLSPERIPPTQNPTGYVSADAGQPPPSQE